MADYIPTTQYTEPPKAGFPWKWVIIVLVVVMVLALTVYLLFFRTKTSIPTVPVDNGTSVQVEGELPSVVETCVGLEGSALAFCVLNSALKQEAANVCETLDEEEVAGCKDVVNDRVARRTHDFGVCDKISEEVKKQECKDYISLTLSAVECRGKGLDEVLCAQKDVVEQAVMAKNPDICDQLEGEMNELCVALVGYGDRDLDGLDEVQEQRYGTSDTNIDSDGDGLDDGDEIKMFGTDPSKADSDDDGFSDKEELDNGFNPVGEGTL